MPAPAQLLIQARRAFEQGDAVRTRDLAQSVLDANPSSVDALALLANAANALSEFATAASALERLRTLVPGNTALRAAHALALNNGGSTLYQDGKLEAAAVLYRQALDIDPDHVLALANLAACAEHLRLHAEAARCCSRLARLQIGNVVAALGHSRALRALGSHAEADDALRMAKQRATARADVVEVGREYVRIGASAQAEALFGNGEEFDDDTLSAIARLQGHCNDPEAAWSRFAALARRGANRGDERARFRAERDGAIVLPRVAADANALQHARAHFAAALDQLIASWPSDRLRTAGVTLDDLACSRFQHAYQGGDDRALATRYGDWLRAAADSVNAGSPPAPVRRAQVRVGLVSARWNQGTIAAYFGRWIGAVRAAGMQVYFFSLGNQDDAVSLALAAQADHAERLARPLAAAAARLRAAELDLLIYPEIGLDPATEVLAALRLAPRQWAAWGHPVTTGLPSIDRFLSVATMEPADAATHYREPLALLPGLGTNYTQPPPLYGAARAALGLPEGPLYAVPHAPAKLHPDNDALLVEIARQDRDARFVFIDDEVPALSRAYRQRVDAALRGAGLEPERHCVVLPRLPIDGYRHLLACVDVVLDTLYFSGGNTSLDALAQATPVVTIEGRFMRGRQTAAMLRMIDADAAIARDVGDAATIAIRLAHAPPERAALSAAIQAGVPKLFGQTEALDTLCQLIAAKRN